jgi:hypothetical protein
LNSMSSKDLMDHTPILRPQPVFGARWPLTHCLPRFPPEEHPSPGLDRSPMAILLSSHKTGRTKPQAKSFKQLVSRIGQRTQLAPPEYADSTKLRTAFSWGRWTQYVDCSIHGPSSFFVGAGSTRPALHFVRKSMSLIISRLLQEPSTPRRR